MTATRTIDAHHHFWRVAEQAQPWRTGDHEAIARDFLPIDLDVHLRACDVDATLLVQSVDSREENERLDRLAGETPFVAGVVAWLPLTDPPAAADEMAHLPAPTRGVRCLVGHAPIDRLERPDALAVLTELAERGLAWDVVPVTAEQTRTVLRVAREVPGLRVVVDHLARPPLDVADGGAWERAVRDLATCPNVAVKVSVGIDLLTRTPWDRSRLCDAVQVVADQVGPRRMMLASNWPVVLLRRSYVGAWSDLVVAVRTAGIDGEELAEVCGGTAARWYGLADLAC
ncbi:MAG: amidohydrolase family protein [Actinomycetes bacterium]